LALDQPDIPKREFNNPPSSGDVRRMISSAMHLRRLYPKIRYSRILLHLDLGYISASSLASHLALPSRNRNLLCPIRKYFLPKHGKASARFLMCLPALHLRYTRPCFGAMAWEDIHLYHYYSFAYTYVHLRVIVGIPQV